MERSFGIYMSNESQILNAVVAGTAGGLLMASLFVCIAMLMLVTMVRRTPQGENSVSDKFKSGRIALYVTFIAYPSWAIIGAIAGVLYNISSDHAPGSGIGSPNLMFTISVITATVLMSAPFALLLKRFITGVITISITTIGIFGWLIPHFAA